MTEDADYLDFMEFLRPPTITCRLYLHNTTDRRKARRLARRLGQRFRVVNTRPRQYFIGQRLHKLPLRVRVSIPTPTRD